MRECICMHVCTVCTARIGFFFNFIVLCTMTIKTFRFWLNLLYTAVFLELSARIKGKVWGNWWERWWCSATVVLRKTKGRSPSWRQRRCWASLWEGPGRPVWMDLRLRSLNRRRSFKIIVPYFLRQWENNSGFLINPKYFHFNFSDGVYAEHCSSKPDCQALIEL